MSTKFVSLPYNVIKGSNIDNFNGYFLTKNNQFSEMSSRQVSADSYNDYWSVFVIKFRPITALPCPTYPTSRIAKTTETISTCHK